MPAIFMCLRYKHHMNDTPQPVTNPPHVWTKPVLMSMGPVCYMPGTTDFYKHPPGQWNWIWCNTCNLQRWTPVDGGQSLHIGKRVNGLVTELIPCPGQPIWDV